MAASAGNNAQAGARPSREILGSGLRRRLPARRHRRLLRHRLRQLRRQRAARDAARALHDQPAAQRRPHPGRRRRPRAGPHAGRRPHLRLAARRPVRRRCSSTASSPSARTGTSSTSTPRTTSCTSLTALVGLVIALLPVRDRRRRPRTAPDRRPPASRVPSSSGTAGPGSSSSSAPGPAGAHCRHGGEPHRGASARTPRGCAMDDDPVLRSLGADLERDDPALAALLSGQARPRTGTRAGLAAAAASPLLVPALLLPLRRHPRRRSRCC